MLKNIILFVTILLIVFCYYLTTKYIITNIVIFIGLVQCIFVLLFILKYCLPSIFSKQIIWVLLCISIFCRLLYFNISPKLLSDDVYRYAWDGLVQHQSINPYRYAPIDKELDYLKSSTIFTDINHKSYKTIYPPVAQYIFYLSGITKFLHPFIILRIIYLLIELIMILIVIRTFPLLTNNCIIYLFCPLIIIESYIGIHIDIVGISLLVLSILFFKKKNFYISFGLLGLSILIKYISIIVVPIYILETYNNDKKKLSIIKYIFFLISVIVLCFIPYITAGKKIFESFLMYNNNWEFNSSLFYLLNNINLFSPRVLSMLILCIVLMIIFFNHFSFEKKIMYSLFVFIMCTHTVYPWYLIWLSCFIIFFPQNGILLFMSLIFYSYSVLIDYKYCMVWEYNNYYRLLIYIPTYIFIIGQNVNKNFSIEKIIHYFKRDSYV
jgi:hypothetical protein